MTTTQPAFCPSTLPDAPESIRARAKSLAKRLRPAPGRKLRDASKCWTVARAAKEAARDLPAIRFDEGVPVIDTALYDALYELALAATTSAR
jgi:hypothetical protein